MKILFFISQMIFLEAKPLARDHVPYKKKKKKTILFYPRLSEEELKRFGRSLLESRYYLSYEIVEI